MGTCDLQNNFVVFKMIIYNIFLKNMIWSYLIILPWPWWVDWAEYYMQCASTSSINTSFTISYLTSFIQSKQLYTSSTCRAVTFRQAWVH